MRMRDILNARDNIVGISVAHSWPPARIYEIRVFLTFLFRLVIVTTCQSGCVIQKATEMNGVSIWSWSMFMPRLVSNANRPYCRIPYAPIAARIVGDKWLMFWQNLPRKNARKKKKNLQVRSPAISQSESFPQKNFPGNDLTFLGGCHLGLEPGSRIHYYESYVVYNRGLAPALCWSFSETSQVRDDKEKLQTTHY